MNHPIAYFITFTTYGTWLHGADLTSVDRIHNIVGTPFLKPNPRRNHARKEQLRQEPYHLDLIRRQIVLNTIREVTDYRAWKLWAAHVRTNHVHIIVTSMESPERVMNDIKAYCSRRIREKTDENANRDRWTQHGSTLWINDEKSLLTTIEYVLNSQGEPMERFPEIDISE